jgi:hypothetical protein
MHSSEHVSMEATIKSSDNGSNAATLTLGDRSYPIADLNDEAQKLALAAYDCENQITRLRRDLDYLNIARRSLLQELTSRLPE